MLNDLAGVAPPGKPFPPSGEFILTALWCVFSFGLFVFGFVCLCSVCVWGCFWCFFGSWCLFDFLIDRDSAQDYVSVLHQFTFAATLCS